MPISCIGKQRYWECIDGVCMSWTPVEGGATLGKPGSEEGIILRDEEH